MSLSIFIAHPSPLLTDHRPHGDGLVAHGFIRMLAERGHALHVAAEHVDVQRQFPPNVHVHPLGVGSLPQPLARFEYMRRLRRLYLRVSGSTKLDVIHQLNPVHVGLTLSLVDARVPVVLGPYVPAWPRTSEFDRRLVNALSERVNAVARAAQQRRATTVLLSTPAASTKLRCSAVGGPLVRQLSAGIDERKWTPGDFSPDGQDILFLANLDRRKGIFVLLDAFADLSSDLPKARLLIAGTGSEDDEVRCRIERTPALRRAQMLGHVPRELVGDAMRACAVYCLPSFGEPFGMTVLEAMSCGKPVVVTAAGGPMHIVDDEGGRRVSTGDPQALAAALREVLTDSALRRRMGQHNRGVIEQRYAWRHIIDRLEDVYHEAIAASRALNATGSRRAAGSRRR